MTGKMSAGFLGLLIFAFSFSANAAYHLPNSNYYVVKFSGGVAVVNNAGDSTTFSNIDSSFYVYNPNHAHRTAALFGVFAGAEFNFVPYLPMELGLAYYQAAPFTTSGHVVQGPDWHSFDIFDYNYQIKTRQVMLEGYFYPEYVLFCGQPYLIIGLGASFNKASDYKVIMPPFITFSPYFINNTNHSFTYSLGLGWDYLLRPDMKIGLSYRFSDLGKADLGKTFIEDPRRLAGSLDISHLYTNEFLAQLSFIF